MDQFNVELKSLFEKTLTWSREFRTGNKDFLFDVDDELYKISIKFGKDFKEGDLLLVYNLLDFYSDAIKHGFNEIDKYYSVLNAESDIEEILKCVKNSFLLDFPTDVKNRLKRL